MRAPLLFLFIGWAPRLSNVCSTCISYQTGANLNKADTTDGSTPLGTASQYGHTEVAAALIGAGADLNQADTTHGRTPLWSSSTSGHIGATRALIAAGDAHFSNLQYQSIQVQSVRVALWSTTHIERSHQ